MELELANKAWARKKKEILASFPNHMLESDWIKFAFPYGLSPRHREAKRNAIGVVGESNAKVPHCMSMSLALIYLMEKKNSTYTSRCKAMEMQLYRWRRQRLKWKDPRIFNVETQIQTNVDGMGIREGIGLRWS
jgi:hypothetical protein